MIQPVTVDLADLSTAWHGAIRAKDSRQGQQSFRVSSRIDYGECLIAPGKLARIKISESESLPYGMCGGNPEISLSLWVDQRHWIEQRQISGHCTESPMSSIVVSLQGVKWCSIEQMPDGGAGEEHCGFTAASQLPRERDLIEYPLDAQPRPEPGTIVIEASTDSTLCRSMVVDYKDAFGRAQWFVAPPSDAAVNLADAIDQGLFEYNGHFSREHFDLDNDGHAETVYGFHPETHAQDADTYFLSPGKSFDEKWPAISDTMLWQESALVFPNFYGSCGDHRCAIDDEDGHFILHSYSENGKPFAYSTFQYLKAQPFLVKGVTYFLLNLPLSGRSHDVSAVLKPRKNQPPEEVCVFRPVLDHY